MKREYTVTVVQDFLSVIEDILTGYKKSKQETLIITLWGDLGAGKTAFTQELGRYLKVTEPITSPTFTIMKQYELFHKDFDRLIHIDAYRIESEMEVGPLKLNEIFKKPRTIVCVEWPERITSILPDTTVSVEIDVGEGDKRFVTLESSSQ